MTEQTLPAGEWDACFSYHPHMNLKTLLGMALLSGALQSLQHPVQAVEVTGLYNSTLAVQSRENERERIRAFATGMKDMLVKLTGHDDSHLRPEVQEALVNPQMYVESWSYQTRADPRTQEQQLMIDIRFYPAGVQELLQRASLPLWPQNRPQTLIWGLITDATGSQRLLNPEGGQSVEEWQALQVIANLRGLPVLAPHWDYEDQTNLLPDQLLALDEMAIRTASVRYGLDSVMVIHADRLANGHISGRALFLFREQLQMQELVDATPADFLAAALTMATRVLADNYAVRVSTRVPDQGAGADSRDVTLSIEGIRSLDDYSAVLRYVESLEGVSELQLDAVEGEQLTFSLNTAGQSRQLIELLAIDRKLQVIAEPQSNSGALQLHYRWQPR